MQITSRSAEAVLPWVARLLPRRPHRVEGQRARVRSDGEGAKHEFTAAKAQGIEGRSKITKAPTRKCATDWNSQHRAQQILCTRRPFQRVR
jgi:hypothetical protein